MTEINGYGEFLANRDYDYDPDDFAYEDDSAYEKEYLAWQNAQYEAYLEQQRGYDDFPEYDDDEDYEPETVWGLDW